MNRQPRTLLTILLITVIAGTAFLLYRDLNSGIDPGVRVDENRNPERGGRLTVTLRSEPRSFNRLVSANAVTDVYSHLAQAKLVRINRATRAVEPWLAERWDESADGRTVTLTLRDGLRWSDGAPFTADDVLFTMKAVYDERARSVLASSLLVDGRPLTFTSPDPRTVQVTFPSPFGPGVRLLDNVPILPRHKLGSALAAGEFPQSWNSATPVTELVGLGPFQLTAYEAGQRLIFARNPNFWRRDDSGVPLPYLDQIVLEIVPDQGAELVRLQAGQSDMMQQALRAEDIAALQPQVDQARVEIVELGVSTDPDVFFLNLRERYWAADPRRAWATRRELRQAISHAIDREAFAESVYLGAAVPVWGPVTPGNAEWFSPNVRRYPPSTEQALTLLAKLGLANRDADEWVEDENGTEARFTVLTYRGNQVLEREAAFVRDELRKVGIALDVVALEQNALIERMLKGDFEAIYLAYNITDLDPALSRDFWLSSGGAHIWNIGQVKPATDWEAEIDALMAQQSAATDREKRRDLFEQVQKIFGEQVPALYFAAPRLFMGVSARTINLSPAVLRPQLLWSADTIAVTP